MTVQILLGCRCQDVIIRQLTFHQKSHQWCLVTLLVIFTNYYASPHPSCNCSQVPTPNLNGMGYEDPRLGLLRSPPVRWHQQTGLQFICERGKVWLQDLHSHSSSPLPSGTLSSDICLDPNPNPLSSHCQIWPPKEGPKLRIDDPKKKKKTSNCFPIAFTYITCMCCLPLS